MKTILITILTMMLVSPALSAGVTKEVCRDKLDKSGKVLVGKDKKPVQECKQIKVHKKLDGATKVPVKK